MATVGKASQVLRAVRREVTAQRETLIDVHLRVGWD